MIIGCTRSSCFGRFFQLEPRERMPADTVGNGEVNRRLDRRAGTDRIDDLKKTPTTPCK